MQMKLIVSITESTATFLHNTLNQEQINSFNLDYLEIVKRSACNWSESRRVCFINSNIP